MSDYSSVAPPQSQQNFSQSSAFAAALQKAKQIAAKIHPGSQGSKRSLEDGQEPEPKKFSGSSDYNNAQSNQGMSPAALQAAAQAAAVAARLSQNPNSSTIISEDIRIPDKMVGLIIGRGGEQITRLQADSGCKIQMASDSGGTQDRICSLSGPRDAVARAREMIQKIVSQHGNGSIEVVSSTTVPSLGSNNSSVYSSGGNSGGGGNGGGGAGGGGYPPYQEIMIPGAKVGLVIGKGGETIKMLQEKTGAKMVVIQDGPGQELEKPLRISGDPQKVEHARQLVYELIQDKESFHTRGNPGGTGSGNGSTPGSGNYGQGGDQAEVDVFVPKAAVGVVIGKGGDMIKKIQGETGCKLQFMQGRGDAPGDRRCIIQGSQQQVDDAKNMIDDLIGSVLRRESGNGERGMNRNNGGNGNYGGGDYNSNQPMRDEVSFVVPASKCGIIIGRGGETIKQINQQSGAYCEMDRKAQNTATEKTFTIKGNPEQIEHARRIISEKIGIQIKLVGGSGGASNGNQNYPGMQSANANSSYPQQWGYTPQSWEQGQQQQSSVQINPSTGQPDYSQQWIEYYRSMGLHREAEIIEQQLKAKQAGQHGPQQSIMSGTSAANGGGVQTAPVTTGVQTSQMQAVGAGQPDYSAQWAEYYRSIGKIDEAEAIENQMKVGKQSGITLTTASGAMPSVPGGYSVQGAPGASPQNMVPGAYAAAGQYPQFYAGAGGGQPGYPQGYGAYGGYPGGAPQPPQQQPSGNDNKN